MPLDGLDGIDGIGDAIGGVGEVIAGGAELLVGATNPNNKNDRNGCGVFLIIMAVIGLLCYIFVPAKQPKASKPPKPTPEPTVTSKVAEKATRASKGFFKEVGRGIWKGVTE